MNTRQKGDYSELTVLAEFSKRCIRVAIPFGNSQGFDMLIESASGWKTVQVKTAYRRGSRNNRIYVDTIRGAGANCKRRRGYVDGSFDVMIAVLPDERLFWLIPFDEMRGRRCITLPDDRSPNWELLN